MPTLLAPPVSTTNKETPRPRVGPLTVPETRSGGDSARRGRPDLSPRSSTRRLSGAPGPASGPTSQSQPPRPHSPGFIPLPARPPSARGQRRPLEPCPSMGATATAEGQPNPLFLFWGFAPPLGAGHVTPRGGIRHCRNRFRKRVPHLINVPSQFCSLLGWPLLYWATPSSRFQARGWNLGSALFWDWSGGKGKGVTGVKSGRRWFLAALHLLKVPDLFCFLCFEKSAQSSRLSDWILVGRAESRGPASLSNLDWLTEISLWALWLVFAMSWASIFLGALATLESELRMPLEGATLKEFKDLSPGLTPFHPPPSLVREEWHALYVTFSFCLAGPLCDNQSSYKNFRTLTELFTSKKLSSLAFALKFFRPRRKKWRG